MVDQILPEVVLQVQAIPLSDPSWVERYRPVANNLGAVLELCSRSPTFPVTEQMLRVLKTIVTGILMALSEGAEMTITDPKRGSMKFSFATKEITK